MCSPRSIARPQLAEAPVAPFGNGNSGACQGEQLNSPLPQAIFKSLLGIQDGIPLKSIGEVNGAEMKKIVIFLFAHSSHIAATPAFASHHRRHHRYHGGQPVVVFGSSQVASSSGGTRRLGPSVGACRTSYAGDAPGLGSTWVTAVFIGFESSISQFRIWPGVGRHENVLFRRRIVLAVAAPGCVRTSRQFRQFRHPTSQHRNDQHKTLRGWTLRQVASEYPAVCSNSRPTTCCDGGLTGGHRAIYLSGYDSFEHAKSEEWLAATRRRRQV